MEERTDLHTPLVSLGDRLELRWGAAVAGGVVVALAEEKLRVRLVVEADLGLGRYRLRHVDRDGLAWGADCQGRPTIEPGVVALSWPSSWEPVPARRAARSRVDRVAILLETLQPAGVRREMVALDVSALGFRATAVGVPPPLGSIVRMTFDTGSYADRIWLHAVVVRASPGSFGRYEIGLRFEASSPGERHRIMRWRDESAAGATAPYRSSIG
jgi:hypothetical protein